MEPEEKKKKPRISSKKKVISITNLNTNTIQISNPILIELADFATKQKVEIYLVGGSVRDMLLNRPTTDFDFTVVGDSIAFAKQLAKKFKSNAVVYEKFRTAMIPYKNYKLEFVGTRKEVYEEDSRNPIVTEGTLEDDIRRRDFTINAMAVALNGDSVGKIIDLFGGMNDLKLKILRTPLDPMITFSDDPLRMLRAARFASQLNFNIDEICLEAIKQMADRIKIISQERITDEFLKILKSEKPSIGLLILHNTGLLKYIFPELEELAGIEYQFENGEKIGHKDIFLHTLKVLDNVASKTDNVWLRFAALTHDIAKPRTKKFVKGTGWTFWGHEELGAKMMKKIFHRMRLPLDNLNYVETIIRLHQRPMVLVGSEVTDSALRRLAFQAGETLEDLFTLCRSDITTNNPKLSKKYLENYDRVAEKILQVQEKDKLREFQSPVRGEEIMAICNLSPSRAVGYIKKAIEEAILDGVIANDYDEAKKYLLENKDKWLKEIEENKI
ncbi:MAG: CCA tRNA nucleotidyltransferase [Candidatus Kapabacteria bacterium]|nr:CCA tRNA nucleotidyltransferase [Candidatus Kapabacteria bacterium]